MRNYNFATPKKVIYLWPSALTIEHLHLLFFKHLQSFAVQALNIQLDLNRSTKFILFMHHFHTTVIKKTIYL